MIMKKDGNINISVTNNYCNFKCGIPMEWLKIIDVNSNQKGINISYRDKKLFITKQSYKEFRELSPKEKNLQIKKYELLYSSKYKQKKELISKMEEYYDISYRTAYRHLKETINQNELNDVELIESQKKDSRNINVMYVQISKYIIPIITIPTNVAILFLKGKTYDELGIKSAYEIYSKNVSCPIILNLNEISKVITIEKK